MNIHNRQSDKQVFFLLEFVNICEYMLLEIYKSL